MNASNALPVRQTSILPLASFRFYLTVDTLAIWLMIPLTGFIEDLHLRVQAPCRAHQEKGKNIALKEDVDEITNKVEGIKAEFQILTHSKTNLNTEKRNAYLNYLDKYFLWLNTLLDISFGNTDLQNNEDIGKYIRILDSTYFELCNSETRMLLWTDNKELTDLTSEIKIETLQKLHNLCKTALQDFKKLNLKIKEINFSPQIDHEELELKFTEFATKLSIYSELNFFNYKNLVNKIKELMVKSRIHLQTMI